MCNKWLRICSLCCNNNAILSSFMKYHLVCNKSNKTVSTSGTGNIYHSGAPELIMFVVLSFFLWPFHCLSFHLGLLISPLVSLALAYRIHEQIRLTTSNGSSEAVNDRKTDNAMAKRKTTTDLRNTAQKTKA